MNRAIALTFALICLTSPDLARADSTTAVIESGKLVGTSDGAVDSFKNIPYAAPPIGSLRWEPPASPEPWRGARDAMTFGPVCPQPPRPDGVAALGAGARQSEDCLSLNVWAPHGARNAPVMVWIHGGAHRFGSGSSPIYDGRHFADDGIVLVTINYRLGLLGYFAHPTLTAAAAAHTPLGNYGQMDQIAALQWVHRNISTFGGDPSNVTVFGESAGGSSILYLLATPSAKGLFAKSIVESGGGWNMPVTLAQKEDEGANFATRAGLPGANATLEQLRAIPVEKTFDIPASLGFGPFIDGRLISQTPQQAFASGTAIDVPMIIGSNSFEASLMKIFSIRPERVTARLTADVRQAYSDDARSETILADSLFTDSVMGAPASWIATRASSGAPSWLYYFSYVTSRRRGMVPGAAHGSEIPYVFETGTDLASRFGIQLSDEDLSMEHLIHSCWVSFAKRGAPDCDGQPWPSMAPNENRLLKFGPSTAILQDFRKSQYDAFDRIYTPG